MIHDLDALRYLAINNPTLKLFSLLRKLGVNSAQTQYNAFRQGAPFSSNRVITLLNVSGAE